MKVRVLFMAMMVAFTSFANAQEQKAEKAQEVQEPKAPGRFELRAKKMAEKFMLEDSKEAKFIPLYQAYLEEKATCKPQLAQSDDLTDAQIEANIKAVMDVREKSLEVDKKYYKKLAKVLNAKQLDMIFGSKAQMGKRPMVPGKDMKMMPPRNFGKPGMPNGKFPKEFMKGGECKKAPGCPKAADCKKNEACKNECKEQCKKDGKCVKGEACPKAGECKKDGACKKDCPKAADCKNECKK